MLERERLDSKKISKTNAVTSIMGHELPEEDVHVGPSDYVAWLTDRKWAHIRIEGRSFGDVPLNLELKLEVWDSPNSAGVVIDAVRLIKLALNNGVAGQLDGPSSYLMKSPHTQRPDDEAREQTEEFIAKYAKGKTPVAGPRRSRPPRRRRRPRPDRAGRVFREARHRRASRLRPWPMLRGGGRAPVDRPGHPASARRRATRSTSSSSGSRRSWRPWPPGADRGPLGFARGRSATPGRRSEPRASGRLALQPRRGEAAGAGARQRGAASPRPAAAPGPGAGRRRPRAGVAARLGAARHRPRPRAVRAEPLLGGAAPLFSLNVGTFHEPQERVSRPRSRGRWSRSSSAGSMRARRARGDARSCSSATSPAPTSCAAGRRPGRSAAPTDAGARCGSSSAREEERGAAALPAGPAPASRRPRLAGDDLVADAAQRPRCGSRGACASGSTWSTATADQAAPS